MEEKILYQRPSKISQHEPAWTAGIYFWLDFGSTKILLEVKIWIWIRENIIDLEHFLWIQA